MSERYGCPCCNEATIGRCLHCGTVRFAPPMTAEKNALLSPSSGEGYCERCKRSHGFGGVYYAEATSREHRAKEQRAKIDAILDADSKAKP